MANLNVALALSATGASQVSSALGGVGRALSGIATTAAGFALGAGLLNLPNLLGDAAKAAIEDEASTLRLSQAIKNLGGDVEGHTKQVNAAIEAGQRLGFTDDDIRDSYIKLTAATGSSEEALTRQQAAMNLARGANISLEQASRMLGKINADNVEVFKRMGITIGENATEADALAAVQAKFGNQADAYAQSTKGQMEAANIAFDEMKESLGYVILPLLTKLGGIVTANLPAIQSFVNLLGQGLTIAVDNVLGGLEAFSKLLAPLASGIKSVGMVVQGLTEYILDLENTDALQMGLENLLGIDSAAIGPTMDALYGFGDAVKNVVKVLGDFATKLSNGDLGGAVDILVGAFADVAPRILEAMATGFTAMGRWIVDVATPILVTKLLSWADAFSSWVVNTAVPNLRDVELPKIGAELAAFLTNVADPLAHQVVAAFEGFWTWVANVAVPNLRDVELPKLGEALASWLLDVAIPWAADNLPKLGVALISGIVAGLSGAWVSALMPWLKNLVSGEGTSSKDVTTILGVLNAINPLTLLSGFAAALLTGFVNGLIGKWDGSTTGEGVKVWLADVPNKITTAVGDLSLLLVASGAAAFQSLLDGMASKVTDLKTWIKTNITDAIPQYIRDLLGIDSPSKVMAEIGENMIAGLQHGMETKLKSVGGSIISGITSMLGSAPGFTPPTPGAITDMSDPQFGGGWSGGWDKAAIDAACGAIAAEGFADYYGKPQLTVGDILTMAQKAGVWDRGGWKGPGNWASFMSNNLGIPADFTDLAGAVAATSQGKPVAISSPSWFHYFLAQGWDGKRFFVGNTGSNALKAGSAWMTPDQIGGGSTFIRGHQMGGWLTEPILGMGLRTGQMHSFVENGRPEYVSPGGSMHGSAPLEVHVYIGDREITDLVVKTVDKASRTGQLRTVVR